MVVTRVLVVDDLPLFRLGLATALGAADDLILAGEAATGAEGVDQALALEPDVVVCAVHLPDANGIEVARRLKVRRPQLPVILLAAEDAEDGVFDAARVGAAGYYTRDTQPAALLAGLRQAARGESLLDTSAIERPAVASRVLRQFEDLVYEPGDLQPLLVPLSAREIGILELIAQGNTNRQIAQRLYLSDQTVKNHITAILRKLAVNDRTQAVVLALRQGWIGLRGLAASAPEGSSPRTLTEPARRTDGSGNTR